MYCSSTVTCEIERGKASAEFFEYDMREGRSHFVDVAPASSGFTMSMKAAGLARAFNLPVGNNRECSLQKFA
jgi:hypothetical protein